MRAVLTTLPHSRFRWRCRSRTRRASSASALRPNSNRDLCPRDLVPFEADERAHRYVELAQLGRAAEVGQIDDEAGGEHLRAQLAQELDRAFGCAAGGDQVVDQNDAVALLRRVL